MTELDILTKFRAEIEAETRTRKSLEAIILLIVQTSEEAKEDPDDDVNLNPRKTLLTTASK